LAPKATLLARPVAPQLGFVIPELSTERLLLRALEPADIGAYAAMYADPEVMQFLEDGRPQSRAAAWRSMAVHLGHWTLRGYGQWALIEPTSAEFVGRAGLWHPEGWPGLEVGWVLRRQFWGRGFASEAASVALGFAFDVVGAGQVISVIAPGNERSVAVAKRLGERYKRTIDLLGRGPHDIYGIDRERWLTLR
jgi:RimJ/RimL family protein N-acetyltransferase